MSQARPQSDLLVVVEPGLDPAGAGMLALGAEVSRLAAALGGGLRCVTWPAGVPVPVDAVAGALAGLVSEARPAAVVLLDTDTGRQLAPMVAHRCGGGAVVGACDVVVRPTLSFVKPVYGGWLQQEVYAADGSTLVATLDLAGVETPDPGAAGVLSEPEVLALDATAEPPVRHLETVPPDARSVDLVHARRIVTAGTGAAGDEVLSAVQELADLLEGSVGATRPVTDDGRLPKERLIGQTGRSVSPELYIALGVSGSPHHVAGVRSAERILSVNRDVRAPIFQFSDVGYVADLEAVLPALVRRISEWRDEPADS